MNISGTAETDSILDETNLIITQVLGVDLAPIQPDFVPPNCKFEMDDLEEDFAYRRPFDFIHCRYMAYAIKDWPRLVKQIYQ